jgi:hypothetical protein
MTTLTVAFIPWHQRFKLLSDLFLGARQEPIDARRFFRALPPTASLDQPDPPQIVVRSTSRRHASIPCSLHPPASTARDELTEASPYDDVRFRSSDRHRFHLAITEPQSPQDLIAPGKYGWDGSAWASLPLAGRPGARQSGDLSRWMGGGHLVPK